MIMRLLLPPTLLSLLLLVVLLHVPYVQALPVFQDYGQPDPLHAQLDLDQRSIVARTALASESGLLQAKDIYTKGVNARPLTLQSLSSNATATTTILMLEKNSLFQKAVEFYGGDTKYADHWLTAALDSANVIFTTTTDDHSGSSVSLLAKFEELGVEGRASAVRWGTVVLNVYMYVQGCLEKAVLDYTSQQQQESALQHWDMAFAYYTGSLAEEEHPTLGGYMLYNLAQVFCSQFGTCSKGQEAPVNTEILQLFVQVKEHISNHATADTATSQLLKQIVRRMQALMTVPLIQATLKVAYELDLQDDTRPEVQGEAAAFGAAMAPIIYNCSEGSAGLIYNDLSPGGGAAASFEVIKAALERQYDCIGITCADVGGYVTLNGDYFNRAEACDNVQPVAGSGVTTAGGGSSTATTTTTATGGGTSANDKTLGVSIGLVLGAAVGAALLTVIIVCLTKPKKTTTHLDDKASSETMDDIRVEVTDAP